VNSLPQEGGAGRTASAVHPQRHLHVNTHKVCPGLKFEYPRLDRFMAGANPQADQAADIAWVISGEGRLAGFV